MASALIDFYQDSGEPYDWEDIIYNWGDAELEGTKDYIQWLFPLDKPSKFNEAAPLLTAEDIAEFNEDVDLMDRLETSLRKFLEFLGLSLVNFGGNWIVVKSSTFSSRRVVIWNTFNHNWMRITRILKSLKLLGRDDLANSFFSCLQQLRDREGIAASGDSFGYWQRAVK